MKYNLAFKPRVRRDLRAVSEADAKRILGKVELLRDGLSGDVKRLTNFTPEYRLRVGDHRVLFEIERDTVVVYRVVHRREAYR